MNARARRSRGRSTTGAPTRDAPRPALCADGRPPGPPWPRAGTTGARSTRRSTSSSSASTARRSRCAQSGTTCGCRASRAARPLGSRHGAEHGRDSTSKFAIAQPHEMLSDQLEIYRRGVDGRAAARRAARPPFDVDNNWMTPYPQAYVIPVGAGQRSDAEANAPRRAGCSSTGSRSAAASRRLHASAARLRRGLVRGVRWTRPSAASPTRRSNIGVDVSDRIATLYAPPGAWSHGYLWGADVVTIQRGDGVHAEDATPITKPRRRRRRRRGRADGRRLRARGRLGDRRADAERAAARRR